MSGLILYTTEDGASRIQLRADGQTVWLTQAEMAELFDVTTDNISLHLKNIFSDRELEPERTAEASSVVQREGGREVRRPVTLYNLDAILAVGYRVRSPRGVQFRRWDIRASEKRFYQVRDLLALSVDYDRTDRATQTFFATVQNMLLYAVTGHTAAELILARANPSDPHFGLRSWSGGRA